MAPFPAATWNGAAQALQEARDRTRWLVAHVEDDDLRAVHHPVMGPVAWDLGHIAQQEDLWLVQTLGARSETSPGSNEMYDAYKNPRATRSRLPLLGHASLAAYQDAVRTAALEVLAEPPREGLDARLLADEFLARMVVLHEHQHDETILQHLARFPRGDYRPPHVRPAPSERAVVDPAGFVRLSGGDWVQGVARHTSGTYDNEWPAHAVQVSPFWLQATPVTNGQFLRFVESGGYTQAEHWVPEGHRTVVERDGARAPLGWLRTEGGWSVLRFGERVPLPLDEPVMHVSWYEADAFATWCGCRLPTEAEWEHAATWDRVRETKRRWPWGDAPPGPHHANLDQDRFGPDAVGTHPRGASRDGVHQLIGDVWEWTATTFDGYDGFAAFPYEEYSANFLDKGLKVLRGGSWATRPLLRLGTFRNWDLPERRQIFAGLRLARDAAPDATCHARLRPGPLTEHRTDGLPS